MEHSNIIQVHHPSGMLYEAFCQFTKGHAEASFFQSDAFFRMVCQRDHTEATLLLALARTPAHTAAGKEPKPVEEESLFPGGVLLFRGQKPPDPDTDPQAANTQKPIANSQNPTPNTQPPIANSQNPTANRQPPTPNTQEECDIPGVGRVVGSLLAVTFSGKTAWGRRMRRYTVVFGGPLLAGGTRLDQETRLRNLLNALDRHVNHRSLSVHIFSFRSWDKLFPVFRELGFTGGGKLNAMPAWKALWNEDADSLAAQGLDHAHLEKQLETCFARHGALHKVNRRLLHFFLRLFAPRL